MSWLHRLQQRLSITKNEALTLLSLSLFLLLGTAGRYMCRQVRPVSDAYYAEIDSLFAERSAAMLDAEDDGGHSKRRNDESISSLATSDTSSTVGEPFDSHTHQNTTVRRIAPEPSSIDLNRATLHELEQLPRVGPKIAKRIIAFREAYGPFRSVEELLSVRGIGPKTLELMRPLARVSVDSVETVK